MASKIEIIVQAKNEASSVLDSVSASLGGLAKAGLAIGAAGIVGIGAALSGAAYQGLNFNSTLEQARGRLNAFTKDGKETERILAMIQTRAAKTPFRFQEMADAAAGLGPAAKASGQDLEELIGLSEILAASNPQQGLEGAAFALREALSGDFTSIIERFNLPRKYINDLRKQGIPDIEAVRMAMKQMGLDASLVANLGQTMAGRWSTFKDTLVMLAGTATRPIFDLLSNGLANLNGWLEANQPMLESWAKTIGEQVFSKIADGIFIIDRIREAFSGSGLAITMLEVRFGSFGTAIGTVINIIKNLSGLMSGQMDFASFFRNIFGVNIDTTSLLTAITTGVQAIWPQVKTMLTGLGKEALTAIFGTSDPEKIKEQINTMLTNAVTNITTWLNGPGKAQLNQAGYQIGAALAGLGGAESSANTLTATLSAMIAKAIVGVGPALYQAGAGMASSIVVGFVESITGPLGQQMKQGITGAVSGLVNPLGAFQQNASAVTDWFKSIPGQLNQNPNVQINMDGQIVGQITGGHQAQNATNLQAMGGYAGL